MIKNPQQKELSFEGKAKVINILIIIFVKKLIQFEII